MHVAEADADDDGRTQGTAVCDPINSFRRVEANDPGQRCRIQKSAWGSWHRI